MKKRLLLLIMLSFAFVIKVDARCNDETINALSKEITGGFNIVPGQTDEEGNHSILSVENVPENMYLIIINNTTNEKTTIKNIKDGSASVEAPDFYNIYNYTVKIYSSDLSCENELLRTFEAKSLIYNHYFNSDECRALFDQDKYDFEGCNEYTSKKYDEDSFKKALEKYNSKEEPIKKEDFLDLFYKYYYFALVPIAVLGVYYSIKLMVIRRRKKKDEEE